MSSPEFDVDGNPYLDAAKCVKRFRRLHNLRDSANNEPDRAEYQRQIDSLNREWIEYNGGWESELSEIAFDWVGDEGDE